MKPLHDLLMKFTNQDYPDMKQPFEQDGLIIATSTHSLIAFDKSDVPESYNQQQTPKAAGLIKSATNFINAFNIESLRSQIKNNLIDEMDDSDVVECSHCDGEGEIECSECGHEYECPKCHGAGTIVNPKPTGRQINDPMQEFTINGSHFKWFVLEKLLLTADYLGENAIIYEKFVPNLANYFRVGRATVLLMPCISDNNENTINI